MSAGEPTPLISCETCEGAHAAGERCGMLEAPRPVETIPEELENPRPLSAGVSLFVFDSSSLR